MTSEKVALFGGTFNPPHKGHAKAFESFCKTVCPDVVYVMPSSFPPHKEILSADVPARRFHMARLCFEGIFENTVFSAIELARCGKSFSIDTVNELLSLHDCEKIYMYIGSDMLFYFEKWKDFELLFKKCVLVTAPRCESDRIEVQSFCERYEKLYGCEYIILPLLPHDVSSTHIRALMESNDENELKKHLTERVYGYIIKENRDKNTALNDGITSCETILEIRNTLSESISEKRLSHTLGVEETALEMARIFLPLYGFGEEYLRDVTAAALLHDVTKNRPDEWHEQYLSSFMKNFGDHPSVYHSWSGAYFALERFFVNPRVFRAIFNHTTGRADMDVFEKIIFLADYIEPSRTHASCVLLREKYHNLVKNGVKDTKNADEILDCLVLQSLNDTFSFLDGKGAQICPKLFEAKDFLEKRSV